MSTCWAPAAPHPISSTVRILNEVERIIIWLGIVANGIGYLLFVMIHQRSYKPFPRRLASLIEWAILTDFLYLVTRVTMWYSDRPWHFLQYKTGTLEDSTPLFLLFLLHGLSNLLQAIFCCSRFLITQCRAQVKRILSLPYIIIFILICLHVYVTLWTMLHTHSLVTRSCYENGTKVKRVNLPKSLSTTAKIVLVVFINFSLLIPCMSTLIFTLIFLCLCKDRSTTIIYSFRLGKKNHEAAFVTANVFLSLKSVFLNMLPAMMRFVSHSFKLNNFVFLSATSGLLITLHFATTSLTSIFIAENSWINMKLCLIKLIRKNCPTPMEVRTTILKFSAYKDEEMETEDGGQWIEDGGDAENVSHSDDQWSQTSAEYVLHSFD